MTKAFINYASEDLEAARKLYAALKSISGMDPWLDKESLLPGMRWEPAIRKAIRESDFFPGVALKKVGDQERLCSKGKKGRFRYSR